MASFVVLDEQVVADVLASVGGRDALDALAAGCSTEWWTGHSAYDLVPYTAKTNGWPAGKQVDEPAVRHDNAKEICLDAEGRKVLERGYWQGKVSSEAFHLWRGDEVLVLHYTHNCGASVDWIGRWRLEHGRAVAYELRTNEGWKLVRGYEYDDAGRLTRYHLGNPDDDVFTYEHDATDKLVKLERTTRGRVATIFAKKAKGASLSSVLQQIDARLRARIPAVLAKLTLTEPVFCLALVYELEQGEVLPPRLALGEDAYRKQQAKPEHLWNPAEWRLIDRPELALGDPELDAACALANQLLAEAGNVAPARKLLATLAAELEPSTFGALPRTQDFVLLALHGDDAALMEGDRKVLAKRLPPEVRKQWKAAGWL